MFSINNFVKAPSRHGFTLVELLVVAGIVAILGLILLPALSQAKQESEQQMCMLNLKEIGKTLIMHLNDNDEWFPRFTTAKGYWSYMLCKDYAKDKEIFYCPSDIPRPVELTMWGMRRSSSYGYNFKLGGEWNGTDYSLKLSQVKNPSEKIAIVDSFDDGDWEIISWRGLVDCGNRHNNGANVLWIDGHVSWELQDTLISEDNSDWWDPKK